MITSQFQQSCPVIPGHERIGLASFGQCQKKRIVRIANYALVLRRQINERCSLQIVDQRPDSVPLQDALELGIAAGTPNLLDLVGAGDEFKTSFPRAQSRASSTALSICSGV